MKTILFILCAISFNGYSQLETVSISPYWMVSNEFLGSNYSVSNVQFSGVSGSYGQFDASGTTIGLNKGMILTTGTVLDTGSGPHGPNDSGGSGQDNNAPGYQLLSNLIDSAPTFDAAILEFDFVPSVDSISMSYVFGSEEYPEYIGSTFNDVFGIFISGPGIVNIENLAILPNGGGLVSIENVNNGTSNTGPCYNCAYYVNNGNGSQAPFNGSNTYIQYDGHTVKLPARKTGLQIGETYHIIIAIADAADGVLDSGLFIESCETCNYNVGIDAPVSEEIKLYPNPANQTLHIKKTNSENGTVHIYDMNGTLVGQESISGAKSSIDITDLKNGVYVVTFQSGSGLLRSKLVVE